MPEAKTRYQRPTRMNGDIYIAFVTKCRMEGKQIRMELEKIISLYNTYGDSIFLIEKKKK